MLQAPWLTGPAEICRDGTSRSCELMKPQFLNNAVLDRIVPRYHQIGEKCVMTLCDLVGSKVSAAALFAKTVRGRPQGPKRRTTWNA